MYFALEVVRRIDVGLGAEKYDHSYFEAGCKLRYVVRYLKPGAHLWLSHLRWRERSRDERDERDALAPQDLPAVLQRGHGALAGADGRSRAGLEIQFWKSA